MGAKAHRYASPGISHLWLVDPEGQCIECHRREGDEYRPVIAAGRDETLAHPDFPTLAIPVAAIWQ